MKQWKLFLGIACIAWAIATSVIAQPAFLTNGLVAYYPFNGNANDASVNSNNGAIFGTIGLGTNRFGMTNTSLYFNGNNSYIVCTNGNGAFNSYPMTISFWATKAFNHEQLQFGDSNSGRWGVGVSGSEFLLDIDVGAGGMYCQVPCTNLASPRWTHFCVVVAATNQSLATNIFYVNGTNIGTGISSIPQSTNSQYALYIGNDIFSQPEYYIGSLDSIRIYNRALSSNEVAQLYGYESIPPTPQITQNLTNTTVIYGQNATLTVGATSATPLSYQWYWLPANNAGKAIAYAQIISGFVYGVVVTNGGFGYGNVPPVSFTGGGGGSGAAGYATVSNGVVTGITPTNAGTGYMTPPTVVIGPPNGMLSGQTNATLTVTNAMPSALGNYYVMISNSFGTATSAVVNLTLVYPPAITTNPVGFTNNLQTSNNLSVSATGTAPLSYQWALNGTNLSGAISTNYVINGLSLAGAGAYTVQVSNPYGSVTSSPAYVYVAPTLTAPFTGAIGLWGQNLTLGVSALGSGTLNYQWYFNGVPISGATMNDYLISDTQFTNAGLYNVVVTSAYGSVSNAEYEVVVNPANVNIALYPGVGIAGTVGYTYTVQSTTNLADTNSWVTETNLTLSATNQIWSDYNWGNNRNKFYRVIPGQ